MELNPSATDDLSNFANFVQDSFKEEALKKSMDQDFDMIDDEVEEKKNDEAIDAKCICGAELQEMEAQKCYSDADLIECDLCEKDG